jgi:hypothetical protein
MFVEMELLSMLLLLMDHREDVRTHGIFQQAGLQTLALTMMTIQHLGTWRKFV